MQILANISTIFQRGITHGLEYSRNKSPIYKTKASKKNLVLIIAPSARSCLQLDLASEYLTRNLPRTALCCAGKGMIAFTPATFSVASRCSRILAGSRTRGQGSLRPVAQRIWECYSVRRTTTDVSKRAKARLCELAKRTGCGRSELAVNFFDMWRRTVGREC